MMVDRGLVLEFDDSVLALVPGYSGTQHDVGDVSRSYVKKSLASKQGVRVSMPIGVTVLEASSGEKMYRGMAVSMKEQLGTIVVRRCTVGWLLA